MQYCWINVEKKMRWLIAVYSGSSRGHRQFLWGARVGIIVVWAWEFLTTWPAAMKLPQHQICHCYRAPKWSSCPHPWSTLDDGHCTICDAYITGVTRQMTKWFGPWRPGIYFTTNIFGLILVSLLNILIYLQWHRCHSTQWWFGTLAHPLESKWSKRWGWLCWASSIMPKVGPYPPSEAFWPFLITLNSTVDWVLWMTISSTAFWINYIYASSALECGGSVLRWITTTIVNVVTSWRRLQKMCQRGCCNAWM